MDSDSLNRAGILIELIGTLLAAPEILERLLGLNRLENLIERMLTRLSAIADRFLRSEESGQMSGGVIIASAVDYSLVLAFLVLISTDVSTWEQVSWWLPFRWLLALPGLLLVAAVAGIAIYFIIKQALQSLHKSGVVIAVLAFFGWTILIALVLPFLFMYIVLFSLFSPLLIVLAVLMRRLEEGWIRTVVLITGVGFFVSGLGLQFAATF